MGAFALGFLFVIVIPLAEGVLLALLLREMCNRPFLTLPLGGRIVQVWWKQHIPAPNTAEKVAQVKITPNEVAESEGAAEVLDAPILPPDALPTVLPDVDSDILQNLPQNVETSVFDGTDNIPNDLQVGNVLDAMTMETPAANLHNFERIIDASAQSNNAISVPDSSADDMDLDDLQALAEALPGVKIDFSQEIDHEESSEMHSMEKELLGEHFDIEALQQQSQHGEAILAEAMLDVREDISSGTVQVSSPFITDDMPQFAELTVPQTIVPTFSNDWIQESSGIIESSEEDVAKFCFTAESSPLVVRKKKKRG